MIAAASGVALAVAIFAGLSVMGLVRDRGVLAVLLVAIASYYLVFSFENGDARDLLWHGVAFAAFVVFAAIGFSQGVRMIALGLVLHGLFDIAVVPLFSASAPAWWAAFCAGVDITLGGMILMTRQRAV